MITRGKLYVVSTPIGNLKDISLRAIETLKSVNAVICEDTRHSMGLIAHYDIHKPLISFNDLNKESRTPQLLARLNRGETLALISDAGTPGISDPGFYLVRAAVSQGIPVTPVPGASAMLSALVVSGLPTDRFLFIGFLPKRSGRRQKEIKSFKEERGTIIIYETARRLSETLIDLLTCLGPERKIVLAREMTKMFEEVTRFELGEFEDTIKGITLKGEFVVLVSGNTR